MMKFIAALMLFSASFGCLASDVMVNERLDDRSAVGVDGRVLSVGEPDVFGANLFSKDSIKSGKGSFNPGYVVSVGDTLTVRIWGAFASESKYTVDAQGNVFLPSIGPVKVAGVENVMLNEVFERAAKSIFKSNVFVYANLETAQPVKVYVTGYVRKPGLYDGISSESILSFLSSAGGVDPVRGSFVDITVKRLGAERASVNLYHFLVDGTLPVMQFADGDVILVGPRGPQVTVEGDVANRAKFETSQSPVSAKNILSVAKVRSGATHFSVRRVLNGVDSVSRYSIDQAGDVVLAAGDKLWVNTEASKKSIGVSVSFGDGTSRVLVAGVGQTLAQVISSVPEVSTMDYGAIQLMRKSVAERQKKTLETTLSKLESVAYTTPSATQEEALIRAKEAELISKFVERARKVSPIGQVVLSGDARNSDLILEDGDVIFVPQKSSLIMVQGEVQFPSTMVYAKNKPVSSYIDDAGGLTKMADASSVFLMRRSGAISKDLDSIAAGDEIFVMPRVDAKNMETVKAISQIIYQIAVSAKVILGL